MSQEDRVAVFKALLRERAVAADARFDDLKDALAKDPRFGALRKNAERRQAFAEFCNSRAKELREERRLREIALRQAFSAHLETRSDVLFGHMGYADADRAVGMDAAWTAITDKDERQRLYATFATQLLKREREAFLATLRTMREEGRVSVETRWMDVKPLLAEDPTFLRLSKEERIAQYKAFILGLEAEEADRKRKEQERELEQAAEDRRALARVLRRLAELGVIEPTTRYDDFRRDLDIATERRRIEGAAEGAAECAGTEDPVPGLLGKAQELCRALDPVPVGATVRAVFRVEGTQWAEDLHHGDKRRARHVAVDAAAAGCPLPSGITAEATQTTREATQVTDLEGAAGVAEAQTDASVGAVLARSPQLASYAALSSALRAKRAVARTLEETVVPETPFRLWLDCLLDADALLCALHDEKQRRRGPASAEDERDARRSAGRGTRSRSRSREASRDQSRGPNSTHGGGSTRESAPLQPRPSLSEAARLRPWSLRALFQSLQRDAAEARAAEEKRQRRAREKFDDLLMDYFYRSDHLNTSWEEATHILRHRSAFMDAPADLRQGWFDVYMDRLRAKAKSRLEKQQKPQSGRSEEEGRRTESSSSSPAAASAAQGLDETKPAREEGEEGEEVESKRDDRRDDRRDRAQSRSRSRSRSRSDRDSRRNRDR
jgi:hypothetical protein